MHRFLSDPAIAAYEPLIGRGNLKHAVDGVLARARRDGDGATFEALRDGALQALERAAAEGLLGAVNATGVLLHTNLGRAPIAAAALREAVEAAGYSNLEYDLTAGERGSRYSRLTALLRELTGAEDAIVVNNCAAAVLLVLDTFAKGREVVVARNQLVEIGGGFRLPDVFERSGAVLCEVGATNKVYLADYERALNARTALLFRSHRSNFEISGFVHDVGGAELRTLGARAGLPVVEDLGSGALVDLSEYALPRERTVQDAVGEGIDLVAFSGDKLLGGPQAGIVVGRKAAVARLRANPLVRALRVDKVTIALLGATLRLYLNPRTRTQIPFYRMLAATHDELQMRAREIAAQVPRARVVALEARIGGGSLPHATIPSTGIALGDADGAVAQRLRRAKPPVIGRNEGGNLLLDLRTVAPEHDAHLAAALQSSAI